MTGAPVKLSVYLGESDDLADALMATFARHGVETSILLRGVEGFGVRHHLRSERLLTLSERLPLVVVAVDERERIEALLPEVGGGLVTLERVQPSGRPDLAADAKLTVYCGRKQAVGGRPAFVAVVDILHRHRLSAATVLLGVDSTLRGERHRGRFFGRNADVLLMIESVGQRERAETAIAELRNMLDDPILTLERIKIGEPTDARAGGWHKLTVYSSGGTPLHVELVRRLREAGTGGATCVRGIWGYHGDHRPHGDTLLSLRRQAPVLTTIVADPAGLPRCIEIVTEVTTRSGLVTSEPVTVASIPGGKPVPVIE